MQPSAQGQHTVSAHYKLAAFMTVITAENVCSPSRVCKQRIEDSRPQGHAKGSQDQGQPMGGPPVTKEGKPGNRYDS